MFDIDCTALSLLILELSFVMGERSHTAGYRECLLVRLCHCGTDIASALEPKMVSKVWIISGAVNMPGSMPACFRGTKLCNCPVYSCVLRSPWWGMRRRCHTLVKGYGRLILNSGLKWGGVGHGLFFLDEDYKWLPLASLCARLFFSQQFCFLNTSVCHSHIYPTQRLLLFIPDARSTVALHDRELTFNN